MPIRPVSIVNKFNLSFFIMNYYLQNIKSRADRAKGFKLILEDLIEKLSVNEYDIESVDQEIKAKEDKIKELTKEIERQDQLLSGKVTP